jgi:hypothetical protein
MLFSPFIRLLASPISYRGIQYANARKYPPGEPRRGIEEIRQDLDLVDPFGGSGCTVGSAAFQRWHPDVPGFASPIPGNRNSPWSPLLMLVTLLPSLGTVASVWFLLQFLRHHILPILFPPPAPAAARTEAFTLTGASAGAESAPAPSSPSVPDGGNLLYAAFASIVVALALEAFEALFSIVYRAVVV